MSPMMVLCMRCQERFDEDVHDVYWIRAGRYEGRFICDPCLDEENTALEESGLPHLDVVKTVGG